MDLDLKQDKVQPVVETILKHINCTAKEVRRLFLIEDLVDSIKVSTREITVGLHLMK